MHGLKLQQKANNSKQPDHFLQGLVSTQARVLLSLDARNESLTASGMAPRYSSGPT